MLIMREHTGHGITEMPMPDDYEGEVKATLISLPARQKSTKAILYIHGYMDYYFQHHMGEYFADEGYNFYAVDLRKCGRSHMPHQHLNYCRRVEEYFPDIDAALNIIVSHGNDSITLIGHAFGGLLATLYCAYGHSRELVDRLILNSPLLEFNAGWLKRNVEIPAAGALSLLFPYAAKKEDASPVYYMSISRFHKGEWYFDTDYKPEYSKRAYYAWLRAVRKGQKRVRRGLNIRIPVLVMFSDKSSHPRSWNDEAMVSDTVLNVTDILKYGLTLGPNVTPVEVPDGLHDLVLSRSDVRQKVLSGMSEFSSGTDAFLAVLSILGQ
jgi:alpha-beta hydrolase superfamily lysophospholipase